MTKHPPFCLPVVPVVYKITAVESFLKSTNPGETIFYFLYKTSFIELRISIFIMFLYLKYSKNQIDFEYFEF